MRAKIREYHEAPLREGRLESAWYRVVGGGVLGSREFGEAMEERLSGLSREVSKSGMWRRAESWEQIVAAVEMRYGRQWAEFWDGHGDWGPDAAIYLGQRKGRMMLRDLGARMGGWGPAATGQAVSRVSRQSAENSEMSSGACSRSNSIYQKRGCDPVCALDCQAPYRDVPRSADSSSDLKSRSWEESEKLAVTVQV